MMTVLSKRKAFTIVEFLVVTAILAILAALIFSAFIDTNRAQGLSKQTATVAAILERARSMTLSSEADSVYGVHFDTDKAILFRGTLYDSATTSNQTHLLTGPVFISERNIAGGGFDIVFARLTGGTQNFGTIKISLKDGTSTSTIEIFQTGLIEIRQ
jgi:prepilin-type N-terminal cleavage/methylation domain-containing protein